jgi:hypothetical protein
MKVRYLCEGEYQGPDMTTGKVYVVIAIEADSYRIINDTKMPYLYNPNQFELVESERPGFWVTEYGEEQEEYSYPSLWNTPGFFEDFHNGCKGVINQFRSECEVLYGISNSVEHDP